MKMLRPFWQQAFLNAVGPVMTALLVGVLANWITRGAQRHREDQQLRRRLVDQLTAVASRVLHRSSALRAGGESDDRLQRQEAPARCP
jgi:hypothetical protein